MRSPTRGGSLSIPNVPPGRYQMQFFHASVAPDVLRALNREITVTEGDTSIGNFTLTETNVASRTRTSMDVTMIVLILTVPPTHDRNAEHSNTHRKERACRLARPLSPLSSLRLQQLVSRNFYQQLSLALSDDRRRSVPPPPEEWPPPPPPEGCPPPPPEECPAARRARMASGARGTVRAAITRGSTRAL